MNREIKKSDGQNHASSFFHHQLILVITVSVLFFFLLLFISSNTVLGSVSQTITIYSEPSDGISKFLGSEGMHSWVDVRNNETGNQRFDNQTRYYKGILAAFNPKNGGVYVVSRSFFVFNTSIIEDNASIIRAFIYLYGVGANESRVCVVSWFDGNDGIDYDDYGLTGNTLFGVSKAWKTNTYNAIELNEQGRKYVNKKGFTFISCREYDHDFLNISPPADTLSEFRNGHVFADEPGKEKDPYLFVIYEPTSEKDPTIEYNDSLNPNDQQDTPSLSVSILFMVILSMIIVFQMKRYKMR